jgi:hypothetical protein
MAQSSRVWPARYPTRYERRGQTGWDDLALLQTAENALAADDDLDPAFPAIVKTIRDRIVGLQQAQASMSVDELAA